MVNKYTKNYSYICEHEDTKSERHEELNIICNKKLCG